MLEVTAPPRLVLASTSRYRVELLRRLDIPFTQLAADIDERAYDDRFASSSAEDFARLLAGAKADAVAAMLQTQDDGAGTRWVLGADQLAILPGQAPTEPTELLHKPGTPERAIAQLMRLAGREHHLVTAVVLREVGGTQRFEGVDRVVLHMRAFDRAEATAYVNAHAPLDCVGSYRIEDAGIRLFETIAGSADPTSIIGLPLLVVTRLLRRANVLAS